MPRRPLAALLLVASLVATTSAGCSRHGKIAAGSVMAVTGLGIAGQPNTTVTREGWFGGTYEDEDHSNDIMGGLLAATGVVLMLAGLATRDEDETPRTVMIPSPYYYAPAAYTPAPAPEPQPPHPVPTTVINAPNAQTVIVTDTVVVQNAGSDEELP